MKKRRLLVGFILIIASVIGVYAQKAKPSFSWGGITVNFPPLYNVEDLEFDGEAYSFRLYSSYEDEKSHILFYFTQDERIPLKSLEEKKAYLAYNLKELSESPLYDVKLSEGDIIYGIYGDISASLSIVGKYKGVEYNDDLIGVTHDNMVLMAHIRTSNIYRLDELQDIVKSIKWQ